MQLIDEFIPEIDDSVPLPRSATKLDVRLTPQEEIKMRARTLELLATLTNNPIVTTAADKALAEKFAGHMASTSIELDYGKVSPGLLLELADRIQQHLVPLITDIADLKIYIVNKLLFEIEYAKNSKDRIAAIKSLGEVDGVDAFKKRTETTHVLKPLEEVEKELLTVLENIEYTIVERPLLADNIDSTNDTDVDDDGDE